MKKPLAGIINISINNILSIQRALEFIGFETKIINEEEKADKFDLLVLPGVGAYHEAMKKLKLTKLIKTVETSLNQNNNFLGICLGMQLLFNESEEFGHTTGIGFFNGKIENFNNYDINKKTFIGWNKVNFLKSNNSNKIFENLKGSNNIFYSIHSFFANCNDKDIIIGTSSNGSLDFTSCVKKNNVTAFQFHPEKSGINGLNLLKLITRDIF